MFQGIKNRILLTCPNTSATRLPPLTFGDIFRKSRYFWGTVSPGFTTLKEKTYFSHPTFEDLEVGPHRTAKSVSLPGRPYGVEPVRSWSWKRWGLHAGASYPQHSRAQTQVNKWIYYKPSSQVKFNTLCFMLLHSSSD